MPRQSPVWTGAGVLRSLACVPFLMAPGVHAHHLPRAPAPAAAPVRFIPPAQTARPAPLAPPSRTAPQRYYLANDDHSDYLWSADDLAYRAVFLHMLDYYMSQIEATAGLPADHRARFNCDGSIWVWEYEHHKAPAEYARLAGHLRDGSITMPLNALVQLYGAMPAEAVLRSFFYAGKLERRENRRWRLVVPMENQTLPGGVASLWAGCGAHYSWKGICACATRIDAANRPRDVYRFTGPDGQSVLMKWNQMYAGNQSLGGYAEALDPYGAVALMTSNGEFLARWPWDAAAAFGYGWDSLQTTTSIFTAASQALSDSTQRVIVSNEIDFFEDFAAAAGASLEEFGGCFGNEWDLLTASMAAVTARVKCSVEKLRTAEALAAIAVIDDPAFMVGRAAARDSAMLACGLYYEHSWTPGPGVDEATRAAWQRSVAAALARYVDELHADALAAVGARVPAAAGGVERHLVFNPLSWSRTDAADLVTALAGPLHVVDLAAGVEVPSQAVSAAGQPRLRILASDVPPAGYRVYEVRPGAGSTVFPPSASVALPVASNFACAVALGGRGQITSFLDHRDGDRQLVAAGSALFDLGSGGGSVELENAGPVSTTLRVVAGGTPAHETRVTLYASPVDRVDVEQRVTQNFGGTVVSTSTFDVAAGLWRHEEVGMIARAARHAAGGDYADQNARTDYLTLNHFADLSQAAHGVTLSSWDASFFRLGNSTPATLDATSTRIQCVVGMQVDGPGLGISNQAGDSSFLDRYSLWTHGPFDPAASMRMALEHQNPLAATACSGPAGVFAATFSLLGIEGSDVLLWALKPADDGPAGDIVLRVWNLAEASRPLGLDVPAFTIVEARNVTHIETDEGAAASTSSRLTDTLARQQMKSYRLRLAPPSTDAGAAAIPHRHPWLALHPNPAPRRAPRTVTFALPAADRVRLRLYDVHGAVAATLCDARYPAGTHRLAWTPAHLVPGVYFLRLEAGGRTTAERCVIAP